MRKLLVIAAACALSGCWYTQMERGYVSTRPMDLDKRYEVDYTHKITGADRAHGVWIIPFGSPDVTEAVEKTLAEASTGRKVVGIADVNIKFKLLWLYFYSQRWYQVEGYPIYESAR